MKLALISGIALAATLVAVAPVNADHACGADVIDLAGQGYWVTDTDGSQWGYLETNGESGLQRGGVAIHGNPDSCQEYGNPDLAFY